MLAGAALLLAERASDLGLYDLGAIIGPLDGDWWRLVAAQFVYENVGYLFAVGVATAIFGTSLERRYGAAGRCWPSSSGAARRACTSRARSATSRVAIGGNASALGLLCAWLVRDLRDRRAGNDTETDLFGVVAIAARARRDAAARGRPPTPGPASPAPRSARLAGLLLPKRA